MKLTQLTLTCAMLIGGSSLMGCASDSNSKPLPAGENGRTAGGNGAFGETPDRPGAYSAPNTGTTDTDRAPAGAGNGAQK